MRISVDNEYRIILFSIDNENVIAANDILLLNGFLKKSKKDYDREIRMASNILKRYENEDR